MKYLTLQFARRAAVGACAGLLALSAMAQDFRIGFVNTDRIFREASIAKAAQSKLEAEFAKREKEIEAVGNQLKTASEIGRASCGERV